LNTVMFFVFNFGTERACSFVETETNLTFTHYSKTKSTV
jgi:hypothetical protein